MARFIEVTRVGFVVAGHYERSGGGSSPALVNVDLVRFARPIVNPVDGTVVECSLWFDERSGLIVLGTLDGFLKKIAEA